MKIKLIHFNFLSENPDTAYFVFSSFKEKMQSGASVLTEFLFNFLILTLTSAKNLLQKYNHKVLDIFSDIPVKGKLFQLRSNCRAQYPLSCLTAFWIMVSSIFLSCREIFAFINKKSLFFEKAYLEFTCFCRNLEVDRFIFSLQSFGAYKSYLLYRKI